MGEIYLYKDQELLNTSEIIIHPDYNVFTKRFDLALLKLTDLLVISKYVWPVSLPEDNVIFSSTDQCWLAGWGRFFENGKHSWGGKMERQRGHFRVFPSMSLPRGLASSVETSG